MTLCLFVVLEKMVHKFHSIIFTAVIVSLSVFDCESLKCWQYSERIGRTEQTCSVDTEYCYIYKNQARNDSNYGSCDDSKRYGCTLNGCNKIGNGNDTACCCNTDQCNWEGPDPLKCWSYAIGDIPSERACIPSVKYCIKGAVGDVLMGQCDTNLECTAKQCTGSGAISRCCCNADLCNSGKLVTSTLTATVISTVFVIIGSRCFS